MTEDVRRASTGKRVLVIALHYPPAGDAAAIRARNLVRNLQAAGHEVRVLMPQSSAGGEPPPEVRTVPWLDVEHLARRAVGRQPGSSEGVSPPSRWQRSLRSVATRLVVPDLYASWIPRATVVARREVRDAELVISTGGASAHLVAQLAAGRRPRIVDINDLWWRKPLRGNGPIREYVNRRLERMIVRSASVLTVPVDEQGLEVERRWGRRSTTIQTGFDPSDFPAAAGPEPAGRSPREIVFAGTLYTFRLDLLFDALAKGQRDHGWTPEDVRVTFIGGGSGTALATARAHGVAALVQGVPRLPRPDLLRRLVAADALVLPLFAEDPHHLPMRFFDFVGSGRPMIGVGSPDVPAAKLIRKNGLGTICVTSDELVAALEQVVSGPRPPDLPVAARAPFEAATARPALAWLVESTAGGATDARVEPSVARSRRRHRGRKRWVARRRA